VTKLRRTRDLYLGVELATVRKLLSKAATYGYVGAGDVALHEVNQILDGLLAIDARTPLRFTVEQADLTDTEFGAVTGTQTRLVGEWQVDEAEAKDPPADTRRRGLDGFPSVDRTPEDPT
jgi:hypothetical protein